MQAEPSSATGEQRSQHCTQARQLSNINGGGGATQISVCLMFLRRDPTDSARARGPRKRGAEACRGKGIKSPLCAAHDYLQYFMDHTETSIPSTAPRNRGSSSFLLSTSQRYRELFCLITCTVGEETAARTLNLLIIPGAVGGHIASG